MTVQERTIRDVFNSQNPELPSGLVIPSPRGMTVREEDMLADKRKMRDGSAIESILQSCSGLSEQELRKMLLGDRMALLLGIRMDTYGEEYVFGVDCPRCDKAFEWNVNLGDLKVKPLTDEGEGPFTTTLPESGHAITYRLLRGSDERQLSKIREDFRDSTFSALMLLRTVKVEGVAPLDVEFFASLHGKDSRHFRAEYDLHDCGVETGVTVECPSCSKEFEADVQIGPDFFLPRSRLRR